jgi:hypothetical protein
MMGKKTVSLFFFFPKTQPVIVCWDTLADQLKNKQTNKQKKTTQEELPLPCLACVLQLSNFLQSRHQMSLQLFSFNCPDWFLAAGSDQILDACLPCLSLWP